MTNNNAFVAGTVSIFGSLGLVKGPNGLSVVRLTMKSTTHHDAIFKIADLIGTGTWTNAVGDKTAVGLAISSGPLHKLMTEIWPDLTTARKLEYKALRRQALATIPEPVAEEAPKAAAKKAVKRPAPVEVPLEDDEAEEDDTEVDDEDLNVD